MAPPWLLWLYVIGFHAATAQVRELPEENEEVIPGLHSGLLFQPRGLLTLATGVWTAVVRFKHDDVRRQANTIRNQMQDITRTLVNLHGSQPNQTKDEETSRRGEYLSYMLDMWLREKGWMGAEMEAAEEEIEQLRNELRLSRRKRALIPFLGDGLKWLFGTSTEKDTEKLHQEIKHVKTSIGKLHHITELQATLIGALSKEQTTNKRNIALLAKKSEELETTLFNVQQRNEWTMANIRREIDLNQVITSAIRTAGAAVMAFRHETQRICQAMADTQQGRVTPTILTPRDLKETLNSIKNHLPSGWTPAIGKTDTPAEIYSILDVAAIATVGGWEIHIQIPLEYQAYSDFLLYEVKSIPTHFINSSMAVETYTPTNYFAISNDQRLHIEASSQDIRHCKRLATKTICHK